MPNQQTSPLRSILMGVDPLIDHTLSDRSVVKRQV
jgi:hypothetical protein